MRIPEEHLSQKVFNGNRKEKGNMVDLADPRMGISEELWLTYRRRTGIQHDTVHNRLDTFNLFTPINQGPYNEYCRCLSFIRF